MSMSGKIKIKFFILLVVLKRNLIPGLALFLVLLLQEKADVVILLLRMQRFGLVATPRIK
jgi:hypothetical protein